MIARIRLNGMLEIKAESELEAYCLRKWVEEQEDSFQCRNLQIDTSVEEEVE